MGCFCLKCFRNISGSWNVHGLGTKRRVKRRFVCVRRSREGCLEPIEDWHRTDWTGTGIVSVPICPPWYIMPIDAERLISTQAS